MREYDKYQGIRHTLTSNSRERKWITLNFFFFYNKPNICYSQHKLVQIN